jgi:hypothetical protein
VSEIFHPTAIAATSESIFLTYQVQFYRYPPPLLQIGLFGMAIDKASLEAALKAIKEQIDPEF